MTRRNWLVFAVGGLAAALARPAAAGPEQANLNETLRYVLRRGGRRSSSSSIW